LRPAFDGLAVKCYNPGFFGLVPKVEFLEKFLENKGGINVWLALGCIACTACTVALGNRCHVRQCLLVCKLIKVIMYAVIKTGGKQYRVSAGDKIKVEQIAADVGQEIDIDQVLAVASDGQISVGTPLVSGASVKVTVVAQGLHDKVHIFKMRRRKHYQKRQGHRQAYTQLFVSQIASALGTASAVYAAPESKVDDLTKIEGIGPKINQLLVADGIRTFADLAAAPVERLQAVLQKAGARYAVHNPSSWPEQSALAAKGDWEAFKKLTDELDAGKRK
jgi:large subunit ribosomal protein L21